MGRWDNLITGKTARLPGDYGPVVSDAEIRQAAELRPGSAHPAAEVVRDQATDVIRWIRSCCQAAGIPEPVTEHRFHAERRWRFDFAWVDQRIALEVEGGVWTQGRHTRGAGFLADLQKYNAATMSGWRLIRCTPEQLANGEAIRLVIKCMED
jgi:hypothetical protein